MVVLTSFTQPTDGIRHRQNNTTVYVNDNNLGKGTLFIAESRLSWVSDSGNGFSIEYPYISLHAISRDLSSFPQECLFLMLDTTLGNEETNNGNGNGESDMTSENGSESETTEMRLVPDDRGMLDAMFHAMNTCQALHPDPDDSFSDEDFYEDADDEVPMEETDHRMAGLNIEDIEEEEEEEEGEVEDNTAYMVEALGEDHLEQVLGEEQLLSLSGMASSSSIQNNAWRRRVGFGVWGPERRGPWEGPQVGVGVGERETFHYTWDREAAVDRAVGVDCLGEGTVVGMGADMVADMVADTVADTVEDTVVGMAVGGTAVERRRGTAVEDTVEDTVEGTAVERRRGTAVERGVGTGRGVVCTLGRGRFDMARGDISFSAGSNSSQGSSALLPPVHSPQQDHQLDHFDDAEN